MQNEEKKISTNNNEEVLTEEQIQYYKDLTECVMFVIKFRANKSPKNEQVILKKITEMSTNYKIHFSFIKNDLKVFEPQLAEILIKQGSYLVEKNWMLSNRLKKMNESNKMDHEAARKNKNKICGLH